MPRQQQPGGKDPGAKPTLGEGLIRIVGMIADVEQQHFLR